MKRYDFFGSKKINYVELDDEIKTEIGVLGNLDIFTDAHVKGVVETTTKICEEMGMPYHEMKECVLSAYLHDVGKIFIPTEILQKTSRLTDEEYEIMKTHTTLGYDICMKYNQFRYLAPVVRAHHESFDGSGYPDGLKGEQIPYRASLIKVADVYDALTRKRQYKEGFRQSEAIRIMIEEVEKNRMCARFLYYLVSYIYKECGEKINSQENVLGLLKEELETLHELEEIYKEIYDRGYTEKLGRKLKRYDLASGYDMGTNAQLLTSKQKGYEKEYERYTFLKDEYKKLEEQLKYIKHLARREVYYRYKTN